MESFQFQLAGDRRGLLWCLVQLSAQKATGVLRVKQAQAGANEQKKEIFFHSGQVVACLSNRQGEKLEAFLHLKKILSQADIKKAVEWSKTKCAGSLTTALLQQSLIQPDQLCGILEDHFRFRVLNWLSMTRAEIQFVKAEKLPPKVFQVEEVKLSPLFLTEIWSLLPEYLSEEYCRSCFAQKHSTPFRVRGDFPLALPPSSLRAWNQMQSLSRIAGDLQAEELRLAAVAMEFDLVEFGESENAKLEQELKDLQARLKKENFFEALQLKESCSEAELRKAYFALIKKFHPDRMPSGSEETLRDLCESVFAAINEAFSVLNDREKREEYLAELALERAGGREAIEQRLKDEMFFDEALGLLRRNQYSLAYETFKNIQHSFREEPEFQACFIFSEVMSQLEQKALDKSRLSDWLAGLEAASKREPSNASIFYFWGVVLKLAERSEQALKAFDQALTLNPQHADAASEARLLRMRKQKGAEKKGGWFGKA